MDKRMEGIYENIKKHRLTSDSAFMFHCTMCGDCCRNREDILLNPKDLFNLARELILSIIRKTIMLRFDYDIFKRSGLNYFG